MTSCYFLQVFRKPYPESKSSTPQNTHGLNLDRRTRVRVCGLSCLLCQCKWRLLFLKHACLPWVQSKKAENAHPKHSFLPLKSILNLPFSAWSIVGPQKLFVARVKKWMNNCLFEYAVFHPSLPLREGNSTGATMDQTTWPWVFLFEISRSVS